jgi:glycosyltransferase involved in cell wall biosynthesis
MQVTVAICTYNPDRNTLVRALDAIVAQLGSVSPAEVIVIDNNSSPPLAEQRYLSSYSIRLIREPKPGLTAAREAAIKNARGNPIVFVDDDNILGDRYLARVVEAFSADPLLGLLGGCILPEYDTQPPDWFTEFERSLAIRRYAPNLQVETIAPPYSEYFPIGAGLAVRRDLALAYLDDCAESSRIEGRQGSALSSGEDIDLGLFALSQGAKLMVTGALRLTHVISSDRTRREYLERLAVSNVKSSLELEKKWAPRFERPVYPIFSIPLTKLMMRTMALWFLGLWSPRFRIKRRVYTMLTHIRLGASKIESQTP